MFFLCLRLLSLSFSLLYSLSFCFSLSLDLLGTLGWGPGTHEVVDGRWSMVGVVAFMDLGTLRRSWWDEPNGSVFP